jgi:group I intron endonuclease
MDLFKPEYNILKIAGSSTGFKHSPETLLKFKNRKLNPEALANLKRSKAGLAPSSPLRKINHMLATGHVTTVINNKDNVVKVYESIRAAAKDIGVSRQTLSKYVNKDKLLKGIYMVIGKI